MNKYSSSESFAGSLRLRLFLWVSPAGNAGGAYAYSIVLFAYSCRRNSTPRVPGPQWEDTVQPAWVTNTSRKGARDFTSSVS